MSRLFSGLSLLVLVILGLVFAVLNNHPVEFDYFLAKRELPLAALLIATLVAGVLLGMLFSLGIFIRLKRETLRCRRQAQLAEQEVANLRSIPIKNDP